MEDTSVLYDAPFGVHGVLIRTSTSTIVLKTFLIDARNGLINRAFITRRLPKACWCTKFGMFCIGLMKRLVHSAGIKGPSIRAERCDTGACVR